MALMKGKVASSSTISAQATNILLLEIADTEAHKKVTLMEYVNHSPVSSPNAYRPSPIPAVVSMASFSCNSEVRI